MLTYLMAFLQTLHRDEEGQTAVEYGLVLVLIALVIVAALALGVTDVIAEIVAKIEAAVV